MFEARRQKMTERIAAIRREHDPNTPLYQKHVHFRMPSPELSWPFPLEPDPEQVEREIDAALMAGRQAVGEATNTPS